MFEAFSVAVIISLFPNLGERGKARPCPQASAMAKDGRPGQGVAFVGDIDGSLSAPKFVFGGGPAPVEVESQVIVVGPIPLAKFIHPASIYCSPTFATECADPKAAKKILDHLAAMEVYILDRKCLQSTGEWAFRPTLDGYPKIVAAKPLAPVAGVADFTVEALPSAGSTTNAGSQQRQVQIRVSFRARGMRGREDSIL